MKNNILSYLMNYQEKYLKYKNKYLILNKQTSGHNKGKYIYPDDKIKTSKNYHDYFINFMLYLRNKRDTLSDLWLVIGAANKDISDYIRFKGQYDISINNNYPNIQLDNKLLITLSNEYYKDVNCESLPVYTDIYIYLNMYLRNKFSKIIFDWSVTKFVDLKILIPKLLTLLQPGEELYIDTFKFNFNKVTLVFQKVEEKYYLKKATGEAISLRDKKIIDELSHYSSTMSVYVENSRSNLLQVYNILDLSKYIDENEGIDKKILEDHVLNSENEKIDHKKYIDQVIDDYSKIIKDARCSIEFIVGDYPNNPDILRPYTKINEYFLIKKNL